MDSPTPREPMHRYTLCVGLGNTRLGQRITDCDSRPVLDWIANTLAQTLGPSLRIDCTRTHGDSERAGMFTRPAVVFEVVSDDPAATSILAALGRVAGHRLQQAEVTVTREPVAVQTIGSELEPDDAIGYLERLIGVGSVPDPIEIGGFVRRRGRHARAITLTTKPGIHDG